MNEEKTVSIESETPKASETFYIKITPNGPYLIYGKPPIDQEIIRPNEEGDSWVYKKGIHFDSAQSPVALCRCGYSRKAPFCDGAHIHAKWDPRETCSKQPLLENVEIFEGPELLLADNEKYCAFVRFCDAYGRIWNLVQTARTEEEKEIVRHETMHCAAGRLVLFDKKSQKVYEPPFDPSIGIIEDPGIKVSGPIWVKGGIRIESADGTSYEIRNRVTLCRCGYSSNKPLCNGAHASIHYHDGLPLGDTAKEKE